VPKKVFGFSERTSRTISIETGMQNSALAVVLAKSIGADPISYLPGALSARKSAFVLFYHMNSCV
jgi:bile acid:Na+ symporter, BASS family